MEKKIKLIQIKIIDGSAEDISLVSKIFGKLKKELPYKTEFVVTNEKIEVRDIRFLIEELYDIYKQNEKEQKKRTKK